MLGDTRIAPVVVDLVEGDVRILLERVLDAAQALVEVELAIDGEQEHAPVLVQHVGHQLAAFQAGAVVVRSDKQDAARAGRVRVGAEHRNPLLNSFGDGVLEDVRAPRRNNDPCRVRGGDAFEGLQLFIGSVGVRSAELSLNAEHARRLHKTGLGLLPVGKGNVGGDKGVGLLFVMEGFVTGSERREREQNQKIERCLGVAVGHGVPSFRYGRACKFRRKPTWAGEESITTRPSRHQNFSVVRLVWDSAQSVGKRFRDNLVLVFVDNVTDTLSFDHPNAYSVVVKDGHHLADTRNMLLRRVFEPRDCPSLSVPFRGREAGWFFQMKVKPLP